MNESAQPKPPTFAEALRFWIKLGFISFGGPAGQIAIMHRELIEKRRWLSEPHFLHALNFCMLLPGPEAQQLATYLGWRLHGARGGIAAGALFVLPAVFILFALSWLFMAGSQMPWLAAIFHGLGPAVIAIVAEAVLRIGKKSLHSPGLWLLALASFVAIFFFQISFVAIIAIAALIGALGHRLLPSQFPAAGRHGGRGSDTVRALELPPAPSASWSRTLRILVVGLTLWWTPILSVAWWLGWDSTPAEMGLFFSKAAMVTFGGAYAVLPYVAQQAVESHGWLTHAEMMSGLALAETTPGPLIMVLQFVGFVGGWQHPGSFSPLEAATLCALLTTWVTFLPCFIFVFLGAPHVEQFAGVPRLSAALTAITAAVVGVIVNLGTHFARHTLWPDGAGAAIDWPAVALAVIAFVLLTRSKLGLIPLIGLYALVGWAGWMAGMW